MAFPDSDLPIIIEAAFGADPTGDPDDWSWTDISTRLLTKVGGSERLISIRLGRSPLAAEAEPGNCTFWLDSTDGALTPLNPLSTYWPNVVLDLPMRVKVARATDVVVASGFATSMVPELTRTTDGITCAMKVTLSGVLARLEKGTSPARAALHHTILASLPVAFWPLDDGDQSTTAASGISGGEAMTASVGTPEFAETAGPAGSAADLLLLTNPAEMVGTAPAAADTGAWAIEWIARVDDQTLVDGKLMRFLSSTISVEVYAQFESGSVFPMELRASGSGYFVTETLAEIVDWQAAWHHYLITCSKTGGNVTITLYVDGVSAATSTDASAILVGCPLEMRPNWIQSALSLTASYGYAAMYNHVNIDAAARYQAMLAYLGESASDRVERVAGETRTQVSIAAGTSVAMGAQPIATPLDVMRECERTDAGLLGEAGFGLGWIPRSARYVLPVSLEIDLATYNTTAGTQRQVLAPTYDAEQRIDEWLVSKETGAAAVSSTASPKRQDSRDANPQDDVYLKLLADWLRHLTTLDEYRWPNTPIDLAANPELIDDWLAVLPGLGRVVRTGALSPHVHGDNDEVVFGYSMQLGRRRWTVNFSGASAKAWDVGVYGADATVSRYDTLGSTLTSGVNSTATSWSVTIAAGYPLWATSAAHPTWFAPTNPMYILVGGLRYEVTAISGASSPQTFTVVRLGAGKDKAHSAAVPVRVWQPARYAL